MEKGKWPVTYPLAKVVDLLDEASRQGKSPEEAHATLSKLLPKGEPGYTRRTVEHFFNNYADLPQE